jgi:DNA-binding CsgD family transcriptional regulator/tetratricopeptide (TPR) repeat protein
VLLERDSELELAEGFLDGVRGGAGRILLLEGPAGIGKSALLAQLGDRAATRGIDVLNARASQLDRGFPFGVVRQLLERRVRAAAPREQGTLLTGAAGDAAPALGISGEAAEGDAGMRSLHGLYWLAANLAGRGPLVLSVDDAHWADRSSLRWLLYTAPRLAGLPLGIVMTTRPTEPDAEQDLLDGLALDDATTVLRLEPLSQAAVGVLVDTSLGGTAPPVFEAACHRTTGGNPLLVRELLRELAAEGAAPTAERAEQLEGFGVDAVARNVRRRLHGLGPEAALVAQAVAVVGDGATVREVAVLSEREEATVRAAATDLAATDLLLSDARLAFVHPLVRAAVYEDIAPVRRAALHRQVATLREATEDPEQVAVHLLRVDPRSDSKVVEALSAAAAAASRRGAPDAAVTFLRRALAEPPSGGLPRAGVLAQLGQAEALARMDGFEEHLAGAIGELGDSAEVPKLALFLGRAHCLMGNVAGAYDVVEAASAAIDPADPTAPLLEAELLAFARLDRRLRPKAVERVDSYLRRLDRGEQVDALILGALSPWLLDAPPAERAVAAAEAALSDQRLQAPEVSTLLLPLAGYTLVGAGHLSRAGEVFDAGIAEARRRGELLNLGILATARSETYFLQGDVGKAEAEARISSEIALAEGLARPLEPIAVVGAAAILINALVARGNLEEAERCVEGLPDPLPALSELLLPARAELRLAQGRTAEAIADLRQTGAILGEEFHKPIQNWRARLAVTLAGTGARDEARALAAAELEQARCWQAPLAIGAALTASGVVEGGSDGAEMLEQAVSVLEQTEARLHRALALIELGALMRRSGSRAAAREPLRAGMDLATRCGATAHADRAHGELVAAGARPRRDRRFLTGPESLTPGELRVATLAAQGMTDRAIAQRLYVTQAAVQFHLRNTFRKLEIGARGELTAALDGSAETTGR